MTGALSSVDSRIISLLGSGIPPVQVAAAMGITESAISQRMANEQFAEQVALARYEILKEQSARDKRLDSLEDKIIEKLNESLQFIMPTEPLKIARLLQIVNAAKRRGSPADMNATLGSKQIATLTLPPVIQQAFITNINQQVVVAGNQELTTIPKENLHTKLTALQNSQKVLPHHEQNNDSRGTG